SSLRPTGGAITPATNATLIEISGAGTRQLGTDPGASMFKLSGTSGTDEPLQLQPGGSLLQVSGSTVATNQFLNVDPALLNASATLLTLQAGATLTSANTLMGIGPTSTVKATLPAGTGVIGVSGASALTVLAG